MRVIDADELLKNLKKSCKWRAENSRELSLLRRAINIVKEQPTVDAEPVIHGEWEWSEEIGMFVCSNCSWIDRWFDSSFDYCPCCGAKMDGR